MGASLFDLRLQTLTYLNDVTDELTATGERYPTPNCNRTINSALQHYIKILNANYQGYLSTDLPVNLIANVNTYPLGDTFRTPVYQVRRTINQVDYYLDMFQTYFMNIDKTPVSNPSFLPTCYLDGDNLVLNAYPTSNELNAIIIKHQMKIAPLVNDLDELDNQLYELEDCVIIKSAIRLLRSKDVSGALKNVSGWESELKEAEAALWMQAGKRHVKLDRPIPIGIEDNYFI